MKKIRTYLKWIATITFGTLMVAMAGCTDAPSEITEVDVSDLGRLLTPVNLRATEVQQNLIQVAWDGTAPSFTLQYTADTLFEFDIRSIPGIRGHEIDIGGLEEETFYYFRVRGITDRIDVESSHYSDTIAVSTLSEPYLAMEVKDELLYDDNGLSTIMTITWGMMPGDVTDNITSVVLESGPPPPDQRIIAVTVAETNARTKVISDGIGLEIDYVVKIMREDKLRATQEHKTKSGPILTLEAESTLDTTQDPPKAIVTLTWEIHGTVDLTQATFSVAGASVPDRTIVFTQEELKNMTAVVEDLDINTTYTVQMMTGSGQSIESAIVEVTTPDVSP